MNSAFPPRRPLVAAAPAASPAVLPAAARANPDLSQARAAGSLSVAAGTAVMATALSTGSLLSTGVDGAGQAIAFVSNEAGAALLHNARIYR